MCVDFLEKFGVFMEKYQEIERSIIKKFRKDISKPMPHPGALQDPLYHGAVTDDMDDPEYEPNGG